MEGIDFDERITAFLAGKVFAVAGASPDRDKYGNKVAGAFLQNGRSVYPINPKVTQIEGLPCYPGVASLPQPIDGLSIVTPPAVTERIVEEAVKVAVPRIWMQPGAESLPAILRAEELGMNPIAAGPCILVALRYHEA
ncbi:MAG: CoA-binding protein [Pirellulales bacterium]